LKISVRFYILGSMYVACLNLSHVLLVQVI